MWTVTGPHHRHTHTNLAILVTLSSLQSNNWTAGVPNHVQFGIQAIFGILGGPQSNDRTAGVTTHVQFGLYGDFRNSWQATVLCSDCRIRHSRSDGSAVFSGLQVVLGILGSQNSNGWTAVVVVRKGGGVQFGLQVIFEILGSPQSNDRTAEFPPHVQFGL